MTISRAPSVASVFLIGTLSITACQRPEPSLLNRPLLYLGDQAEDIRAVEADGTELARVTGKGLQLLGWSADGEWFAYCAEGTTVHIRNLNG
jgi:hypothetical protein